MIEQLRFYITHSLNDLRVNTRLTFFALLSIAAGVAAIVSLQTLGIMIEEAVTGNLQETNQGDVRTRIFAAGENEEDLYAPFEEAGLIVTETVSFVGQSGEVVTLSEAGLESIREWIDQSDYAGTVDVTAKIPLTNPIAIFFGSGTGTNLTIEATGENVSNLTGFVVDPKVFPLYSDITTADGQPLADVLQAPNDVVLSEATQDTVDIAIGDVIVIAGANEPFTVRGFVSAEEGVSSTDDILAGIFGFYYVSQDAITLFDDVTISYDPLYFRLDDPAQADAFAEALAAEYPFFETTTTEDLREQNEASMEQINQLLTIMGLISLLIGSIGIVNTMQVVVRRRMLEVAVLKTLGMQGEQVTLLFLVQALLLGIIGSLFGIVLGWIATFALQSAAEAITASSLDFVLALSPAINGVVMGVIVTTIFGFLPTLSAAQVRPGIVIRPREGVVPRAGIVQRLLVLLFIILVIAAITQTILGASFLLALGVVAGTFVAAGIIYMILWVLIWLIGRFMPAFGIADLKVSLRQMLASRGRGASTLLALVVGVFSLSTITLLAESITSVLGEALEEQGNISITVNNYNQLEDVTSILDNFDGVNSYNTLLGYEAELVSWEDVETGNTYTPEDIPQVVVDADISFPPFFDGTEEEQQDLQLEILDFSLFNTTVEARTITEEDSEQSMTFGRALTPDDADEPRIIYANTPVLEGLGISEGDRVTYRISNQGLFGSSSEDVTFEVAGMAVAEVIAIAGSGNYAPTSAFPENINPTSISISADVTDERLSELRLELSEVAGVFVLETAILTTLITGLLAQFTAFPTLVAILGLIVGGVVIANSVALATMERRNEIAVMKSVGLQRERVLGMLLLENGILGLIGGFIGVGIALNFVVVLAVTTGSGFTSIPWGTALLLMLLCVIVAIIAALTSAWTASGEKPLTVLRYE